MSEQKIHKCSECGKTREGGAEAQPVCCGKPMVELPVCTKQTVAEHYRFSDDNQPCDDARGGLRKKG